MTKQSMEERFDEVYKKTVHFAVNHFALNAQNPIPTPSELIRVLLKFYNSVCVEQTQKEIQRARQEVVSEVVETLEKLNNEKWSDAKHCTCLTYSTDKLKKKYNLE